MKFAENLQRDPRAEMLKSTENKAVLCPKVLSGKTSFGLWELKCSWDLNEMKSLSGFMNTK